MGAGESKGGGHCTKQDHIDPKPEVDISVGISINTSQQCDGCSLTFSGANTSSAVGVTRMGNYLQISPYTPFTATFNGTSETFALLRVFTPSPLRIQGEQADAVVQCLGEKITMFIPLVGYTGGSGASMDFLSPITAKLDPTLSEGLGVHMENTLMYDSFDVNTGHTWSLTNLVTGESPYFTWVDSDVEQYTIRDTECDRWIGWRSTPGKQVIFFQKPVAILPADMQKITETIGVVDPAEVLKTISNPLYSPGVATDCPIVLPKFNVPDYSAYSGFSDLVTYMIIMSIAVLAIVFAVLIVNSEGMTYLSDGLKRMFAWRTPKPA